MAFQKESKRKTSSAISIIDVNVTSINLKDKLITDGEHTANFQRVLYKGCPVLPMQGRRAYNPQNQPTLIDANRKSLAVKICNTIHGMDKTKRTKSIYFERQYRLLGCWTPKDLKILLALTPYLGTLTSL